VYRNNLIGIFLFIVFSLNLNAKDMKISTDELIVRGLFYEKYEMYDYEYYMFDELYRRYKIKPFLLKVALSSMISGQNVSKTISYLEEANRQNPKNIEYKRFLISMYVQINDIKKAKEMVDSLLTLSDTEVDYELCANVYIYSKDFNKALELLEKVYKKKQREAVLLQIVNILIVKNYDYQKAIKMLNQYKDTHLIVSDEVYKKLVVLYTFIQDEDKVIDTYKSLYKRTLQPLYFNKIMNLYMDKSDFKNAIEFMKEYRPHDEFLLNMYEHEKRYKEALDFIDREYKRTENPIWIAKRGMIIYEQSKNKHSKKLLDRLMRDLKYALEHGVDDASVLNYYGYMLIENDKDVKLGIDYVKQALKQQPKNAYYLDSLGWGYYKIHRCKEAYRVMKKISKKEIEDTIELKEHFDIIKKCK